MSIAALTLPRMSDPLIGRPEMPGYGVPDALEGALPWDWAVERLRECRNYFVASTRPDGRPHLMPVWGCWVHGMFVFSTAITSVKSKNLLANPACVVTVDDGHEAVIVEGTAKIVDKDEIPDFFASLQAEVRLQHPGRQEVGRRPERRVRFRRGRHVRDVRDEVALGPLGGPTSSASVRQRCRRRPSGTRRPRRRDVEPDARRSPSSRGVHADITIVRPTTTEFAEKASASSGVSTIGDGTSDAMTSRP